MVRFGAKKVETSPPFLFGIYLRQAPDLCQPRHRAGSLNSKSQNGFQTLFRSWLH